MAPRKTPFRFLDLPPELRNRICTMAFEGSTTWIMKCGKLSKLKDDKARYSKMEDFPAGHDKRVAQRRARNGTYGLPGILMANKQLRDEALLLFFATTQFVIANDGGHHGSRLIEWLEGLESSLKASVRRCCMRELLPGRFYDFESGQEDDWLQEEEARMKKRISAILKDAKVTLEDGGLKAEVWTCQGCSGRLGKNDSKKVWPRDSIEPVVAEKVIEEEPLRACFCDDDELLCTNEACKLLATIGHLGSESNSD